MGKKGMTRARTKIATTFCLVAGLFLSSVCMLFVCPVVAASSPTPDSCRSAPGTDADPVSCPYTVMRPVYVAPLLDHDFGADLECGRIAAFTAVGPQVAEGHSHMHRPEEQVYPPPGDEVHVRLCVFRI